MPTSRWRTLVETVHLGALSVWFGMLVATVAAAAATFPILRSLDVRLPGYEAAATENYRIVGGMLAQRLFLIADMVMFGCALAALATLGLMLWRYQLPARRPATIARVIALAVALGAFASLLFIVTPALNRASTMNWGATRSGDAAAMGLHRAAIDQLHPIAQGLTGVMVVTVLVALVAAVCSLAAPWASAQGVSPRVNPYPEPALLRRK